MKNSSCVSGRLQSSQHVKEREEGRDLRDGLEVERVFFDRPSRRTRHGKRRSEDQAQSFP